MTCLVRSSPAARTAGKPSDRAAQIPPNTYQVAYFARGLNIVFHKEGMEFDNSKPNPSQAPYLNILGSVAEFERQMLKERQREASFSSDSVMPTIIAIGSLL